MSQPREFEVVLQAEEAGGFSVSVPDLPGCYTHGETKQEALAMAKEAIELYLESLDARDQTPPKVIRSKVRVSVTARGHA